ncbi:RHS repeat-associated core domain-containing protein [Halobacteriovorax vibrionivorans]|uniref:RHS repeat-associated core domain-containing protein n=1 Tax=Halobacteriovorax vibrionivorans TaxID=2152716 RepID=A0ABY0ICF9_9BACT|nr:MULTISPECIES: RHS repeat-associated core domain-containing protein [Halobacteriovorax]RZF20638.1 RHS repeat-associated core domain-containing protein [Halobacteriovorax vibrionivorans]TGD48951.1 RHS repeat-associated core domain-containing protein [Halobacteriovorax sp. Y22]
MVSLINHIHSCIRNRNYNPGLGRFMSEDPIGFEAGDFNFYRYVSNQPVRYTDPSGNVSPASLGVCGVALVAGGLYDYISNIKNALDLQKEYEAKLKKLEDEEKTCNPSRKDEILIEKAELLLEYEKAGLLNAAFTFLPGAGSYSAVGVCIASFLF